VSAAKREKARLPKSTAAPTFPQCCSSVCVCPADSGFIEPCLPSPADKPPSGSNWIHEIKHDGFRLMPRPRWACGGGSSRGRRKRRLASQTRGAGDYAHDALHRRRLRRDRSGRRASRVRREAKDRCVAHYPGRPSERSLRSTSPTPSAERPAARSGPALNRERALRSASHMRIFHMSNCSASGYFGRKPTSNTDD
jgi:hypothetical protein